MKSNQGCYFGLQYVTQTVEVESADSQKALAELQTKNAGLQEQLSVQRQLLRELETQLHESQRTCAQLRTQVTSTVCLLVCFSFLSESQTDKPPHTAGSMKQLKKQYFKKSSGSPSPGFQFSPLCVQYRDRSRGCLA